MYGREGAVVERGQARAWLEVELIVRALVRPCTTEPDANNLRHHDRRGERFGDVSTDVGDDGPLADLADRVRRYGEDAERPLVDRRHGAHDVVTAFVPLNCWSAGPLRNLLVERRHHSGDDHSRDDKARVTRAPERAVWRFLREREGGYKKE